MSSRRGPLKVSGLVLAGKVKENPNPDSLPAFGAGVSAERSSTSTPDVVATPAPSAKITSSSEAAGTKLIPLNQIVDSPYQPRINYDPAEIDNLAHTLAAAGQKEPVSVRYKDGKFELISGHRRVRAARSIGWTEIRANVEIATDEAAETAAMISNEARVDLSDYERGKLYAKAMERGYCVTQNDVAHFFGTTQGRVSRCVSMLSLPDAYIKILENNPSAFHMQCALDIRELLKAHPQDAALIEQGVKRIVAGEADQKGLKSWVQQMIRQRSAIGTPTGKIVVTNSDGKPMFTARTESRTISVRINDTGLDEDTVMKKVLDALKEMSLQEEKKA